MKNTTVLVSACLVGLNTRYNGECKPNAECLMRLTDQPATIHWLPLCPEQLGGLPTPREAADIVGGDGHDVLNHNARVVTKTGVDVTAQFILGAHQVLAIARMSGCRQAWLKARSPSCAVCGTIGVTAALLAANKITLIEY